MAVRSDHVTPVIRACAYSLQLPLLTWLRRDALNLASASSRSWRCSSEPSRQRRLPSGVLRNMASDGAGYMWKAFSGRRMSSTAAPQVVNTASAAPRYTLQLLGAGFARADPAVGLLDDLMPTMG
ncbi:hypothetical protein LSAT2_029961, partial [Lamellibrachia satsuma]